MRLSEIFDQFTYGELAQVSFSGQDDGFGIQVGAYDRMVTQVNLALTELYKRFPLKKSSVTIQQYDAISTYYISTDFAVSNVGGAEPVKYLVDTVGSPFPEDLLKIESIVNDAGDTIPLNDCTDETSISTPSYNAITVPVPSSDVTLTVNYRANHKRIISAGLDPDAQEVEIPRSHLEPLLYYVASRILTSQATLENNGLGMEYMLKFEQACTKISELDIMNKEDPTNLKSCNNGWA